MTSPTSSSASAATGGRARSGQGRTLSAEPLCPNCGGVGYYLRDLPISHPEFGKAIPCHCQRQEQFQRRLTRLQRLGSLETLQHMQFDGFIPEPTHLSPAQKLNLRRALETCQHYAQEPEGWLLLSGPYGCGKTHLAAAIANQLVAQQVSVLFMLVPDLLDQLRAAFDPESELGHSELFEQVRNVPVLILDDLGAQRGTAWAQEKLFQLLNHRYNAQLTTVITTNQRLEDLDPRLRSRLSDSRLVNHFVVIAPDFRSGQNATQSDLGTLALHGTQTFASFVADREDLAARERQNLKKVYQTATQYAANPEGWLVLIGGHGCGKTHLGAAIANGWQEQNLGEVTFISTPDLLDHLRAAFDPDAARSYDRRFDAIKRTPLLVVDDLGTESATPWAREKLFQLLNYRYDALLPTVITAYATIEQVGPAPDEVRIRTDALEPWLQARIFDINRCQVCAIYAPGYRTSRNRLDQPTTSSRARRTK